MRNFATIAIVAAMFCWLLLAESAATASISATLNLNYVSESLSPGNTANIQGGGFTNGTSVQLQPVAPTGQVFGNVISPTVVSRSANLIQIQIPASFTTGLWMVWLIDDAGNTSVTRYINQAVGVRFNSDAVAPGGTVEVWGRNLGGYTGATSSLLFMGTDGTTYPATVTLADANHLIATVPSTLIPGASYQVYVSNGLGGSLGYTMIAAPLSIRVSGADPLNLGVPWAADFTFLTANWKAASNTYNVKTDPRLKLHAGGAGATDDTAAIQAAIDLAAKDPSGGGIVYLPAGTYTLVTTASSHIQYLLMRTGVVVMGDGPTRTTVRAGLGSSPTTALINFFGANHSGISGLTFINLNNGVRGNYTIECSSSGNSSCLFFQNVDFQLNNGQPVVFWGTPNLLITNSTFESTSTTNAMFTIEYSPYLTLQNDTFSYRVGRMTIRGCDFALIRNNVFNRDGHYSAPHTTESGGIEASIVAAPVISTNQFNVSAGAQGGNNDGETILTQDASPLSFFRDAGTITTANGLAVTDTTKNWSAVTAVPAGEIIMITSGVALGQWRYVTAITPNSITIDHPWDFTPPPGSQYSISGWSADRVFVLNNTFINAIKPDVEFWEGAWYSTVSGNYTSTAGAIIPEIVGIVLNANDTTLLPSLGWAPSVIKHIVCWENQIFGNTVFTSSTSKTAEIRVQLSVSQGSLHGNGTLNNEIRGNLVATFTPAGLPSFSFVNGYYAMAASFNATVSLSSTNVVVGTIFEGNSRPNYVLPMYHLGLGLLQTVTD